MDIFQNFSRHKNYSAVQIRNEGKTKRPSYQRELQELNLNTFVLDEYSFTKWKYT